MRNAIASLLMGGIFLAGQGPLIAVEAYEESNMKQRKAILACSAAAMLCGFTYAQDNSRVEPDSNESVQSLFYKAQHEETGNMWDVWLTHHEGTYFLYYLANADVRVGRGQPWNNISLATSPDGVHWTEQGPILKKSEGATWMGTGSTWKSSTFEKDGTFYMNFSEEIGERQNIYFAESTDLRNWTRLKGKEYQFVQDERWYKKNGRWDCIWTIAKPGGGFYGYWTASPLSKESKFGFGESEDGLHWKALEPPKVVGVKRKHAEVGAVEKIGDKYYMLMGNYAPYMVTLVAEQPEGPFHVAKKNSNVLTGHTYFSMFAFHTKDFGWFKCFPMQPIFRFPEAKFTIFRKRAGSPVSVESPARFGDGPDAVPATVLLVPSFILYKLIFFSLQSRPITEVGRFSKVDVLTLADFF